MNCNESKALLVEFALGHLDPSRANEVQDHLSGGCDVCAKELTDTVEAWARLATDLEPVKPSPEVESRLMAMIRGEIAHPVRVTGQVGHSSTSEHAVSRLKTYVLAASLLGVVAGLLAWKLTPMERMLAQPSHLEAPLQTWGIPRANGADTGFQTVSLQPIAETKGVQLTVVVNRQTQEWHIVGTGLPKIVAGDVFRIWFETKSGKFRSVTLSTDRSGNGGVAIEMKPSEQVDLASLWLTVETSADGERPSGEVLFRASIK